MPLRLIADAQAQTTVPGAITAAATTIVGQSTANFTQPQNFGNGQISLTILDAGNPGWNPAAPLATPYEYVYCGNNNTGTNTFGTLTRGVANTTAHAFFAGAIIAQGLLAEDFIGSAPWKFDDQVLSAAAQCLIPATGSIPSAYLGITWRHLEIRYSLRAAGAPNNFTSLFMQFNGDFSVAYAWGQIFNSPPSSVGYNESFGQTWMAVGEVPQAGSTANTFGEGEIMVSNYTGSGLKKARGLGDGTYGLGTPGIQMAIRNGIWNNTSVVTSVRLFPQDGTTISGLVTTYLHP